ncbi:MAG: transporter substrate-binding domain-containing protein [Actinomycetota bacterium]|nr:transporter substrate-binding domain-containing protein [Actinomycetota bacterium]
MRRTSLLCLVVLSVVASCVPPETDPIRRFAADTPLGEFQKAGIMRIAVDTNWTPFGAGTSTDPRGFAVDLGTFVASEMGMETEFIGASSSDEVVDLVNEGEADLGFAAVELTEENVRNNSLTDPFFIAHQRLLAPTGSGITDIDDLDGKRVCEVVEKGTGVSMSELTDGVEVVSENDLQACIEKVQRSASDAVAAPDGHLLPWLEPSGAIGLDFELVGDEATTVGWAAIASPELSGLVGHFNDSLAEAKVDGDWSEWYARWIEPFTGERDAEPPGLSLEEAAALFPSSLEV